ncbi:hypothetical protein fugu_008822 [Takifugu bimaculatus]|uniref:Uncharacterized protein n=1 Tax=Takifugu bimaculatus TaxID=433685 RepID=A0A4Z2AX14_9TELE|nr:hypothetical protein fugu_008822 [Takifugu bimaculatus]
MWTNVEGVFRLHIMQECRRCTPVSNEDPERIFHTIFSSRHFDQKRQQKEHMSESMQEFYTVLDELVGDQSVDQVRLEFEKLIQALKKSRENEKRLMSKCRELNAEIVSSSTKVSAALQLSQDDQTTITSLKRELDKAWKMVDAANDKEKRDKEAIKNLKDEIAKLMEQAKQSVPSAEQEQIDLLNPIEALTKERDQLLTTAEDLREKLKETIRQTTGN